MQRLLWPTTWCHVDADAYYCSVEKLRHPELGQQPVCVLSSNDACVVSKCYRAKAAGIKTGMPVWEAKKILPDAAWFSADFGFYGQVSDHMFMVFRQLAPHVEQYSIDEAFLDVSGLLSMYSDYQAFADQLRTAVLQQVGVTVSVGVSVTRTLAKMASEFRKPNGTTVVDRADIPAFLDQVALTDIPGIAQGRAATLAALGITTARAFSVAPEALLRNVLGKVGVELRRELNGEAVYPLETEPALPKSIGRTASLGHISGSRDVLRAHLTGHVTRLALELSHRQLVAGRLAVFIRYQSFDAVSMEFRLKRPTGSFAKLMALADEALTQLFVSGGAYRGCGVIATDIAGARDQPLDLFGNVGTAEQKQERLLQAMTDINRRFGNGTVMMLAALPVRRIKRETRFRYPMLYLV